MKRLRHLIEGLSRWLDNVAETLVAMIGRLGSPRAVELVEGADGAFTLRVPGKAGSSLSPIELRTTGESSAGAPALQGNRAEIVLLASRFVFRQLELPRRAAEFLDGVVRAQIDRLTPWSVKDAVFGWSQPHEIANERIIVTVAATARVQVMPLVQAATDLGAESVTVSTIPDAPEHGGAAIKVLDQKAHSALGVRRVRGVLIALLMICGLAAAMSVAAAVVIADDLAGRQNDLSRRIADRRAALRAGLDAASNTALSKLERRKHEEPSAVTVLEALSKVLPDHTFVTELRIEGRKLQVIGVTRDAPSLIGLIEQSPHFTRATFFAPTTRSPSDPGERFHIEARLESVFGPRT
jgi:general secretion pathway protein L